MEVDPEAVAEVENEIVNHEAFGKPYKIWSPRDFELGKILGCGKFGHVHIALEKKTKDVVAIKVLSKSEIMKFECEDQIIREVETHSRLKHPNILRLFTWFHDEECIYLVVEYAEGRDLYKHLASSLHGGFRESKAARYIYQVADAVDYCHKNDVIHRDIKPENILVVSNGDLKLADIGWSVDVPSARRKDVCSTLNYLPPEMIKKEEYNIYVDHWCIGILLYEFLVGKPPFEGENQDQTYARILSLNMSYPKQIPEGGKDLISKLLKLTSTERLPLDQVKTHYWVQNFQNV